jgi:hypothetical protein
LDCVDIEFFLLVLVLKVVSFSNDLIWVFLVYSSGFCGISLVQKWFLESDKSQLL